jgi:predicted acyl esterase
MAESGVLVGPVVERDRMIPMRDGVSLGSDVYRLTEQGVYPVLLTRTPNPVAGGVMDPMLNMATRQGFVAVRSVAGVGTVRKATSTRSVPT